MNTETADIFRRRRDGVLELVPRVGPAETAKRSEIAIAVLFLTVGIGSVVVRNFAMAVVLLVGGGGLLASTLLKEYRAKRSRRRAPGEQERAAATHDRRVIRLDERLALWAQAPGLAANAADVVDSAASPRD